MPGFLKLPFAVKFSLVISALAVGMTTVSVSFLYIQTQRLLIQQTAGRLKDVGQTGSFLFDASAQASILRLTTTTETQSLPITTEILSKPPGKTTASLPPEVATELMASADFQSLVQIMRRISEASRAEMQSPQPTYTQPDLTETENAVTVLPFLMVGIPESPDHKIVKFISSGFYEPQGDWPGHPIGTLYHVPEPLFARAFEGEAQVAHYFYTDVWGTWLTAVIPIKNMDGEVIAILGLDFDATRQANKVKQLRWLCGAAILVSLGLSIVMAIGLAQWLGPPIAELRAGAERVRRRDYSTLVAVKSPGELRRLADAFNAMVQEIRTYATSLEFQNQALELVIQERTRELQGLFAAIPDLIFVFDAEGRHLKIPPTNTSSSLFMPLEDRVGKTVHELFPSDLADLFLENIGQALATQSTVNVTYKLDIGNRTIWSYGAVAPISINSVIWVSRDITDRKQALEALQQTEAKYRSIFENAVEGIFQFTPDGRYLSANQSLAKLYGYESPEDLLANLNNLEQKLYVNPADRKEFVAKMERDGFVSNFEYQIYRKDGSTIWTSENARAVRGPDGTLLYYEGTVEDISLRKETELALKQEQERSEELLLNILPAPIAEKLKQDQSAIAESFDEVTILFADIVSFTPLSTRLSPIELVSFLNQIFSIFDKLAEELGLEKIKTIGDAYMVAAGLPVPRTDHAEAIADMALAIQRAISEFQTSWGETLQVRMGINTGTVVAGVIGTKKFIYDLWGDTVNVASRMEAQGEPSGIQVTEATYARLKHQYQFEKRGAIPVKGKGNMVTYWLIGK